MNELRLTEDECNRILDYLGSRPYIEVYKLVQFIQNKWIEQNKPIDNIDPSITTDNNI